MINPILIIGITFVLIAIILKNILRLSIFHDIFLSEKIKIDKDNIERKIKKLYISLSIIGISLSFIGFFIAIIHL